MKPNFSTTMHCQECPRSFTVEYAADPHQILLSAEGWSYDPDEAGVLCPGCTAHRNDRLARENEAEVVETLGEAFDLVTRNSELSQIPAMRFYREAERHQNNPGVCAGCRVEDEAVRIVFAHLNEAVAA